MRGQLLGSRYRIQNRIGEGGMAFVYMAVDEKLGRKVAIKVLHRHMAENPDIRARFYNEARAISTLEHANIVKIYDFSGEDSKELWIVTEILKGLNLSEYVKTFPGKWLHPIIATCIVNEILRALEVAHAQNIIHRDIKPENVMILDNGRVKLMDFGIAKNMRGNSMTVTGTFMGSPSYMSCEQVKGKLVDQRSDIYSLGVLFYEIITGKLPFIGNSTHDVVLKICEGQYKFPRLLVPNLPQVLNDVIIKSMSLHPNQRFQSANSLSRILEQFLTQFDFAESHIELERFFADRESFVKRLRAVNFNDDGTAETKAIGQANESGNRHTTKNRDLRTAALDIPHNMVNQNYAQNDPSIQVPPAPFYLPSPTTKHKMQRHVEVASQRDNQERSSSPSQGKSKGKKQQGKKESVYNWQPTKLDMMETEVANPTYMKSRTYDQAPGQVGRKKQPVIVRDQRTVLIVEQLDWLSCLMGIAMVGLILFLSFWSFSSFEKRINPPKNKEAKKNTLQNDANTRNPERVSNASNSRHPEQSEGSPTEVRKPKPSIPVDVKSNAQRRPSTITNKNDNRVVDLRTNERIERKPIAEPATPIAKPKIIPTQVIAKIAPAYREPLVMFGSSPASQIYLNGKLLGTTNDSKIAGAWMGLPAGQYQLELRRAGYKTYVQSFSLNSGDRKDLSRIRLEENGGISKLIINSTRSPVNVEIQNLASQEVTRVIIQGKSIARSLNAGRYRIFLKYKDRSIERTINMDGKGEDTVVDASFED